MKKTHKAISYLLNNPTRAYKILIIYKKLKGKYLATTVLAHAYKEALYQEKKLKIAERLNFLTIENGIKFTPTIVSIHDGTVHTGGLTDRLKGLCSLYIFAKKYKLDFKIHFVSPFILQKYLLPNNHDWNIEEHEISYDLDNVALYTYENEKDAAEFLSHHTKKQQFHVGCNSMECADTYSQIFHQLFVPTPYLKNYVDSHLIQLGGAKNYVTISFRFQNLLGEFEEANSRALSKENQEKLINNCIRAVHNIRQNHLDCYKILITSDSNKFRKIISESYSYVHTFVIPDEEGHMDYAAAGKGKELTAFLDMFLIAESKKSYQIRSKEMYNSDFPMMAAKINNVSYEVVLIP